MTEISFYLLPTCEPRELAVFVCKLVEKAYRSGIFCYLLTASDSQSQQLDDLLWTFRPGAFIPHQIYAGTFTGVSSQILIGSLSPPPDWQISVINLTESCPSEFKCYRRLIEIIPQAEEHKALARTRYRHYQEQGFEPVVHQLAQL